MLMIDSCGQYIMLSALFKDRGWVFPSMRSSWLFDHRNPQGPTYTDKMVNNFQPPLFCKVILSIRSILSNAFYELTWKYYLFTVIKNTRINIPPSLTEKKCLKSFKLTWSNEWNKLPLEELTTPSIEALKILLDYGFPSTHPHNPYNPVSQKTHAIENLPTLHWYTNGTHTRPWARSSSG